MRMNWVGFGWSSQLTDFTSVKVFQSGLRLKTSHHFDRCISSHKGADKTNLILTTVRSKAFSTRFPKFYTPLILYTPHILYTPPQKWYLHHIWVYWYCTNRVHLFRTPLQGRPLVRRGFSKIHSIDRMHSISRKFSAASHQVRRNAN